MKDRATLQERIMVKKRDRHQRKGLASEKTPWLFGAALLTGLDRVTASVPSFLEDTERRDAVPSDFLRILSKARPPPRGAVRRGGTLARPTVTVASAPKGTARTIEIGHAAELRLFAEVLVEPGLAHPSVRALRGRIEVLCARAGNTSAILILTRGPSKPVKRVSLARADASARVQDATVVTLQVTLAAVLSRSFVETPFPSGICASVEVSGLFESLRMLCPAHVQENLREGHEPVIDGGAARFRIGAVQKVADLGNGHVAPAQLGSVRVRGPSSDVARDRLQGFARFRLLTRFRGA